MSSSLADLFFTRMASKGESSKRLENVVSEKPTANLGKTLKLFTRTAAEDGEVNDEPQIKLSALERERKMREDDIASRQHRVAKLTTKESMELQREEMSKVASELTEKSFSREFAIENEHGEKIKFDSSMWK